MGEDESYENVDFDAGRKYTAEDCGRSFKVKNTETDETVANLRLSTSAAVLEIAGSVLEDDLAALAYCYCDDDIYFGAQ